MTAILHLIRDFTPFDISTDHWLVDFPSAFGHFHIVHLNVRLFVLFDFEFGGEHEMLAFANEEKVVLPRSAE